MEWYLPTYGKFVVEENGGRERLRIAGSGQRGDCPR
jgi:hypothetical protein